MRKLNTTIAAGLAAAVIGAILVFFAGQNIDKAIAKGATTRTVLVATENFPATTSAETVENGVTARAIPEAYVAEGALASLDDVASLALTGPVSEGSQLTRMQFASPEQVAQLQPSKNHIALAVQVDLSPGVARYVNPASYVDVFATYENIQQSSSSATSGVTGTYQPPDAADAASRTKLFVSGVRVLSVTVAKPVTEEDEEAAPGSAPLDSVIAVLDVSPRDAERIVNATTLGKLYLGLSAEGEKHQTPKGVTPNDVVRANR